jgi:DnaJ-class molecular chaperone
MQDVNKEPGAEEKFKKIGEAYEVGKRNNATCCFQAGCMS